MSKQLRPAAGVFFVLVVTVGCAATPPSPTAVPTPSAAATAASVSPSASPDPVSADLDMLVEELERSHPQPFHGISRDEFVAALDAYEAALPGLTDDEAVVELMRAFALLSRAGRDGHQFAFPQPEHRSPVLPIRVYEFDEGVFITAAAPPNGGLVAASITAINGSPIADVLDAIEPLVPRDSPATVPAFRPIFLVRTEVLRGLGIIDDGPVELAIDHHGFESVVAVEPIAFDEYVAWAGGQGMHQLPIDERMTYLADASSLSVELMGTALYIRYRSVVPPDMSEAREILDGGTVERLILDLRQNPGGDNGTYSPIVELVRDFAADHPGALRVLIDRVTFSAASNLASEIERRADPIFIGEPMGGGLNFWADVRQVPLDALPVPMQVSISTRYWQFAADADDPRLTIEPDVLVPVRAEDHFVHRDPALTEALSGEG